MAHQCLLLILSSVLPCFLWHSIRLFFLVLLTIFPFPWLAPFLLVCPEGVDIFHVLGSSLAHPCSWFHLIHFYMYYLLSVAVTIPSQYPWPQGSRRDRPGLQNLRKLHCLHMSPGIIEARGVMWHLRQIHSSSFWQRFIFPALINCKTHEELSIVSLALSRAPGT